jgi:hypothetical protein
LIEKELHLIGFASTWLVDLGFVSHAGPTCALLMPDDPEEIDLHDQEQFNLFRASVIESLHVAGLTPEPAWQQGQLTLLQKASADSEGIWFRATVPQARQNSAKTSHAISTLNSGHLIKRGSNGLAVPPNVRWS